MKPQHPCQWLSQGSRAEVGQHHVRVWLLIGQQFLTLAANVVDTYPGLAQLAIHSLCTLMVLPLPPPWPCQHEHHSSLSHCSAVMGSYWLTHQDTGHLCKVSLRIGTNLSNIFLLFFLSKGQSTWSCKKLSSELRSLSRIALWKRAWRQLVNQHWSGAHLDTVYTES